MSVINTYRDTSADLTQGQELTPSAGIKGGGIPETKDKTLQHKIVLWGSVVFFLFSVISSIVTIIVLIELNTAVKDGKERAKDLNNLAWIFGILTAVFLGLSVLFAIIALFTKSYTNEGKIPTIILGFLYFFTVLGGIFVTVIIFVEHSNLQKK